MAASGTPFQIVDWPDVAEDLATHRRAPWAFADLDEVAAQCNAGQALCLRHPDGIVIVELLPHPQDACLELWIRIACGFRAGAFRRAESDLVGSIARDLGAKTVAFKPARRGWKRLLGPAWSQRGDDFTRPIDG